MEPEEATRYRAVTARLNNLSADRPDIQYAVVVASRGAQNPTTIDEQRVKRIVRYLAHHRRLVWRFELETEPKQVVVFIGPATRRAEGAPWVASCA